MLSSYCFYDNIPFLQWFYVALWRKTNSLKAFDMKALGEAYFVRALIFNRDG